MDSRFYSTGLEGPGGRGGGCWASSPHPIGKGWDEGVFLLEGASRAREAPEVSLSEDDAATAAALSTHAAVLNPFHSAAAASFSLQRQHEGNGGSRELGEGRGGGGGGGCKRSSEGGRGRRRGGALVVSHLPLVARLVCGCHLVVLCLVPGLHCLQGWSNQREKKGRGQGEGGKGGSEARLASCICEGAGGL